MISFKPGRGIIGWGTEGEVPFYSVSLSKDGNMLAVGVPRESNSASGVNASRDKDFAAKGSGAVYVFTRKDGVWVQQDYVKANDINDLQGLTVSLSGDGNTLASSRVNQPILKKKQHQK